jgi:hypothetical protein
VTTVRKGQKDRETETKKIKKTSAVNCKTHLNYLLVKCERKRQKDKDKETKKRKKEKDRVTNKKITDKDN